MATTQTVTQNQAVNTLKTIALWVLQVCIGVMFITYGYSKLIGTEMYVQVFQNIGIGQWFRYFTGAVEITGGVLLFIPSLVGFGALLICATMVGAILTHMFVIGGSPMMAIMYLIFTSIVLYARWDQVRSLFISSR